MENMHNTANINKDEIITLSIVGRNSFKLESIEYFIK